MEFLSFNTKNVFKMRNKGLTIAFFSPHKSTEYFTHIAMSEILSFTCFPGLPLGCKRYVKLKLQKTQYH